MAFSTLDTIRTGKLNIDLGLSSDSDNRFGTTADRNFALQDAFGRLWPSMARLVRQALTLVEDAVDYTLTDIRDLQTIEVLNSDGIVTKDVRNFRVWTDESADPVVRRVLLPVGFTDTTVTLRAIGYAPYTVPATGSSTCDLEPRLEWIVVTGARAFLYRRRFNQFVDFERRQHENLDNAVSPSEFFSMYQDAERQFTQAILDHGRRLELPRSARLRR